jgi:hypothetical protein
MKGSVSLAVCLLGLAFALGASATDELSLSPRRAVLLLNNGELISGLVTAAGDRYDVTLDGGEIHVQRSHVALVAADAQECYVHKRAGIEPGRVQDHLELAEWCLRHNLSQAAEDEISAARAIDDAHPKLRLLETRLRLAAEGVPQQAAEPIKTTERARGDDQLDLMTRHLPHGVMESFANSVQPMLLNYCSRSGCHGTQGDGPLRLERIPPNRRAGRKPTQRNLQAALAMIDRAKPDESKLLTAPLQAHGGLKSPVFGEREHAQYKLLVQWVYQAAGPRSSPPPTLSERGAPLLQTVRRSPAAERPAEIEAASAAEEESTSDGAGGDRELTMDASRAVPTGQPLRAVAGRGQPQLGSLPKQASAPKEFVPKDVFDPAIFNRRFFGE